MWNLHLINSNCESPWGFVCFPNGNRFRLVFALGAMSILCLTWALEVLRTVHDLWIVISYFGKVLNWLRRNDAMIHVWVCAVFSYFIRQQSHCTCIVHHVIDSKIEIFSVLNRPFVPVRSVWMEYGQCLSTRLEWMQSVWVLSKCWCIVHNVLSIVQAENFMN